MNAGQLSSLLAGEGELFPEDLVMVMDSTSGEMYSIEEVVVDHHEDGLAPRTVWIKVDPF